VECGLAYVSCLEFQIVEYTSEAVRHYRTDVCMGYQLKTTTSVLCTILTYLLAYSMVQSPSLVCS